MGNILFQYSYTNAERIRRDHEIVFANPDGLTLGEIEYQLKSRLQSSELFDPFDFMVPALYGEYTDFHINSRLHSFDSLMLTVLEPTDKRNIADFIANIK